jgi:hypothetical protein
MSPEQSYSQTRFATRPSEAYEALTVGPDIDRKDLEGYGAAYIDPSGPMSVRDLEYTYQNKDSEPTVGKADLLAVVESGPTGYRKIFAVAELQSNSQDEHNKRFGLLRINPRSESSTLVSEITVAENVAERSSLIGRKDGDRYRPGELFTYMLTKKERTQHQSIQIRNRSLSGSTVYTAPSIVHDQQMGTLLHSGRPVETLPRHRRQRSGIAYRIARILDVTIRQ